MEILDAEERVKAIDAVRLLYQLGLIGMFVYGELIAKIERNTGI